MKTIANPARGRRRSTLFRSALAGMAVLTLSACDDLLEVEDPDVTLSEDLFDPGNLPALRATAVGDFAAAFSGTSSTAVPGLVHASGLLADEFWHSGTFGQNREMDRRQVSVSNGFIQNMARNMYRARRVATLGFESYEQNDPNTAAQAEMANIQGFIYVFFAENFCSGVPFSEVLPDGRFEYSGPLTTTQMFERAIEQFGVAQQVAQAAGSTHQLRLATLGEARARLGLGQRAQAAALVNGIPTGWIYYVEHSANTGRQNNGVWGNNHGRREIALASEEGGNGIDFRRGDGARMQVVNADPRLPWRWDEGAADSRSIHYFQLKYSTQSDSVALASGVQARLIEAEALLDGGQSSAYLGIINGLRADVGLGPLSDPGEAPARIDQFFTERAMFLFGTANRLSDLRRLVRQYGRTRDTVFPTGTYFRPGIEGMRTDGVYANDVNFPVTIDEENNPQFEQCIDRNA
jgi:starch-binding outer membrane protein, SusD/RagB family